MGASIPEKLAFARNAPAMADRTGQSAQRSWVPQVPASSPFLQCSRFPDLRRYGFRGGARHVVIVGFQNVEIRVDQHDIGSHGCRKISLLTLLLTLM